MTNLHQHKQDTLNQMIHSKEVFGFWLYIMTDCIIFAVLFATYVVLRHNTYGGPSMKDIVDLPYVFGETLFLLTSSFTYGLAILNLYKKRRQAIIFCLMITFILGLGFIIMEVNEFAHLIHEGYSWQTSGFLSGFFTLVGTHGFHVSLGLLWMIILAIKLSLNKTISPATMRKLTYLGLFWSFLDIVWIFIFTIVYLMGAI